MTLPTNKTTTAHRRHRMPFGAELLAGGEVRFRLWAPAQQTVLLRLDDHPPRPMQALADGWFELVTDKAAAGSHYRYQFSDGLCVPDPASRANPQGVHEASEVIDPGAFEWQDDDWRGRPWHQAVIYEVHVGSFTLEGTFAALERRLHYLAELGVTAIELMPLAAFPGGRNWGYDGTLLFAPHAGYGTPEDLKRLIQSAHRYGLMVFLDVVYNHFGPEGNYLHHYAPQFFSERHHTPWGAAINFDGESSRTVRDFYIHNALYWLLEYHLDGLRLDAVHAIRDDCRPDILQELAETVRNVVPDERQIHLVLENDHNAAHYLQRQVPGSGYYDAQWNDDLHHACHVLLSGEQDGYYADYLPAANHLGRCLSEGFAYQGEPSAYREGESRGEPSRDLPPTAFVSFLQNHDQVGNRAFGERLTTLAEPQALAAATALLLLAPAPPLLFMGEEWGAEQPFPFFCQFGPELAQTVTEGRRKEFAGFARFRDEAARAAIPDPGDEQTFLQAKLDWHEVTAQPHHEILTRHRQLLALRRKVIVPRLPGARSTGYTVLSATAVRVSWRLGDGSHLQLLANLGAAPAPLDGIPPGELLYALSVTQLTAGQLPAWCVAWYLRNRDEPG